MSYPIVSIGVSQLGNVARQKYCTEGSHSLEDASSFTASLARAGTANRDRTH